MKHTATIGFLAFLLFCGGVFGQYPKDEVIDPYGKPVKERVLVHKFECGVETLPQWRALHQSKLSATEDRLVIESVGSDPYVLLPEIAWPEGAPRAGVFELEVRMKNGMNPKAEFFWSTEATPGFTADAALRFSFRKNEKDFSCVRFETESPLLRLRFDPGTSEGVCELESIELYRLVFSDEKINQTPWYDPNWAAGVEKWVTISDGDLSVRFDDEGLGAQIFLKEEHVGDIYPLVHLNESIHGARFTGNNGYGHDIVPLERGLTPEEVAAIPEEEKAAWDDSWGGPPAQTKSERKNSIELFRSGSIFYRPLESVEFWLENDELHFEQKRGVGDNTCGPVFRPKGEMRQALLCGVEYLEQGEHSSATADIETAEHLRHAPKPLDVTWPFMAIVTEKIGFGLYWKDPETNEPIFATPDFLCGDPGSHYLGLRSWADMAGTLKIKPNRERKNPEELSDLEELILWAVNKHGLPEPLKPTRSDEAQRLLNLAAFESSLIAGPEGWRHAAIPGAAAQSFPMHYGNDFVSAIWMLTGKLPDVPRLDRGGGHLRNPVSFFLMQKGDEFLRWIKDETRHLLSQQSEDGSFRYKGEYLKGHWDDTASGHCGNAMYRLMENHRVLGDPEILVAVRKGLDFANRFTVPRGAQVWELSLHTPDIMGSSRMCMANVRFYEATGETKYLDAARRWAVTGLPFVYLWTSKEINARPEDPLESFRVGVPITVSITSPEPLMLAPIMLYATTPVFGATNYRAPNWIGLPVQWCGLDYGEALFLLAEHDTTLDWRKIAEGILITAEWMQYPDGPCVGLLPDSLTLDTQMRNPADINPSVLVMQRRRLQGKTDNLCIALSEDGRYRVAAPFKVKIETDPDGRAAALVEGAAGTVYQILVNGKEFKTVTSRGLDRIPLP